METGRLETTIVGYNRRMGYEEVDAILPTGFRQRPDRPPKEASAIANEKTEPEPPADGVDGSSLLALAEASLHESHKNLRTNKRKRRKKRGGHSPDSKGNIYSHDCRRILIRRWRSSRSRGRKHDRDGADTAADEKQRSQSKEIKLLLDTIGRVDSKDSNATEKRTNTSRGKDERGWRDSNKQEEGSAATDGDDVVPPTTNTALSVVHEGNPDNAAGTAASAGENSSGTAHRDENEVLTEFIEVGVGGDIEQITIAVEPSFGNKKKEEDEEVDLTTALSMGSAKSNKSITSNHPSSSKPSGRLINSKKSSESTRSGEKEIPTLAVINSSQSSSQCTSSMGPKQVVKASKSDKGEEALVVPKSSSREVEGNVKSSIVGRFRQMLQKSKSVDNHCTKKKGKVKLSDKERTESGTTELSLVRSVDDKAPSGSEEDEAAGNRTITETGTGFALKISKGKGVRERITASENEDAQKDGGDDESMLSTRVKKVVIGREHQIHENVPLAPRKGLLSLPLPLSFCDVTTAPSPVPTVVSEDDISIKVGDDIDHIATRKGDDKQDGDLKATLSMGLTKLSKSTTSNHSANFKAAARSIKSKKSSESIRSGETKFPTLAMIGSTDSSGRSSRSNRPVNSDPSILERFRQTFNTSKVTSRVNRSKEKKGNGKLSEKKKRESGTTGPSAAMSVDAKDSPDEDEVAQNRTITDSLGPGFAFLKTSETKEVREHTASEGSVKQAVIGREYRMHKNAPLVPGKGLLSLSLPVSFCDDGSDRLLLPEKKLCLSKEEAGISRTTSDDSAPTFTTEFSPASSSALTRVLLPKKGNAICKLVGQTSSSGACGAEANEVTTLATCKANRSMRVLLENTVENAERSGSKAKDDDSLSSFNSDSNLSIRTELWSTPPKLQVLGKDDEDGKESIFDMDLFASEESCDAGSVESASIEDLDNCKPHAHRTGVRQKFTTREALEDQIAECALKIRAAVDSAIGVDKQTLARVTLADDEARELLPLCLILPTVTELTKRIGALNVQKQGVLQSISTENARTQYHPVGNRQSGESDLKEKRLLQKRTEWMDGYD